MQRMLGFAPWNVPIRNLSKVLSEYDEDKFGHSLCKYRSWSRTKAGLEGDPIDFRLNRLKRNHQDIIITKDGLCSMTAEENVRYRDDMLYRWVEKFIGNCPSVVELGCGYAQNLYLLWSKYKDRKFLGGELCANAIELANALLKKCKMITVKYFNFYDPRTYDIILSMQPPILLFTHFALEQLPSAKCFVETISNYRDRIKSVIHFEPVVELYGDSILGLLQRKYTEINDYNRDLYACLQKTAGIEIIEIGEKFGGMYHPTVPICWQFEERR